MATLAYMHFIKYKREELVLDDFAFNLDESKIFSINKRDELLIKKGDSSTIINSKGVELRINSIVGRNGVGKTSLLKAILEIFTGDSLNYAVDEFIDKEHLELQESLTVIFCENDKYFYYSPTEKTIEQICDKNVKIKYMGKAFSVANKWYSTEKNLPNGILNSTAFIEYNTLMTYNSFEQRLYKESKGGMDLVSNYYDITTSYLMQKDSSYHMQDSYHIKSNNYNQIHEIMDKRRQFKFLYNTENAEFISNVFGNDFHRKTIKLFPRIFYKADMKIDLNGYRNPFAINAYLKTGVLLDDFRDYVKKYFGTHLDGFTLHFFYNMLYVTIKILENNYESDIVKTLFRELKEEDIEKEDLLHKDELEDMYKMFGFIGNIRLIDEILLIEVDKPNGNEYGDYIKVLSFIDELIKNIKKKLNNPDSEVVCQLKSVQKIIGIVCSLKEKTIGIYDGERGIDVDLTEQENCALIEELFDLEEKLSSTIPIMQYKFNDFSSGETAFVNIFARLDSIKIDIEKYRDLICILDEPELYLHPEWQRRFIYCLRLFFEKSNIYRKKKIQIIISTNTSFLLSDFKGNEITYLKKSKEGYTDVDDNIDMKTFGANIHSILRNSFFIESTVGEYAKRTISGIIDEVKQIEEFLDTGSNNQKKLQNKSKLLELKKMCDCFGDSIVKSTLINYIDEIYGRIQFELSVEVGDELQYHIEQVEQLSARKE